MTPALFHADAAVCGGPLPPKDLRADTSCREGFGCEPGAFSRWLACLSGSLRKTGGGAVVPPHISFPDLQQVI